jgi:hypothetical protein
MAKIDGKWLIATSVSRRTGSREIETTDKIPAQFPRNKDGKVF